LDAKENEYLDTACPGEIVTSPGFDLP
jgi:hypothetical protein